MCCVRRESGADFASMLKQLKSGDYDALVLDAPVLEYTVGTNPDCDLFTAGEPFETFSQALAFPRDFNDALIFQFSEAIVKLQTYQGALDVLDDVYVKNGGVTRCFSGIGGHGKADTIQLRQVSAIHNYRNPVAAATLRSISGQIWDLSDRISGNLSGTWGYLSRRVAHSAPGALGGGQSVTARKAGDQSIQLGGIQECQPDDRTDMLSLSRKAAVARLPQTIPRGILNNSDAGGQTRAGGASQAGAASRSADGALSHPETSHLNSGNVPGFSTGKLSHGGARSASDGDGLKRDGSVSVAVRSENSKLTMFLGTSEEAYSARSSNSCATESDDEMP